MKNSVKVSLIAAAIATASQAFAGTPVMHRDTVVHEHHTFKHTVKHTARSVGHKTSEIAAKGESAIVDKKYEGKCGPNGETVYINKYSHYYYVDKAGHRVYVKKSELMDKKM